MAETLTWDPLLVVSPTESQTQNLSWTEKHLICQKTTEKIHFMGVSKLVKISIFANTYSSVVTMYIINNMFYIVSEYINFDKRLRKSIQLFLHYSCTYNENNF